MSAVSPQFPCPITTPHYCPERLIICKTAPYCEWRVDELGYLINDTDHYTDQSNSLYGTTHYIENHWFATGIWTNWNTKINNEVYSCYSLTSPFVKHEHMISLTEILKSGTIIVFFKHKQDTLNLLAHCKGFWQCYHKVFNVHKLAMMVQAKIF